MKFLSREDFKYTVELECPHNGEEVRSWCSQNCIPFVYRSIERYGKHMIVYVMTEEKHATLFTLRWG
jgi:hypothetical protein